MEFKPPFGIFFLLIALPLLVMMTAFLLVGLINQAFQELGFSPLIAFFLIVGVLIGSVINIPVWNMKGMKEYHTYDSSFPPKKVKVVSEGVTKVSVNVGGAIIPAAMSVFLLSRLDERLYLPLLFATTLMALACYKLSRTVEGRGIAMPALVPPVLASLMALLIAPHNAASIAFISGVTGVLVGADLMNMGKIMKVADSISIGGAGTFDGIFLTGMLSVLLVAIA